MMISWEWRIENGTFFYAQYAIFKIVLLMFNLQWLLVENGELSMAIFQFSIRHSHASIFHTQFTMMVSWELRIENGHFSHSQFAILKQAFFVLNSHWFLIENGELRMGIFPFSIRHSQSSSLHVLFTMMVSWEWRIENGHFFYSQFAILKQAFFTFNFQWLLVENGELRMAIFHSQFAILKQAFFTLNLQWLLFENDELRMAIFFHSQFAILKQAFFTFYLQWWLVENGELRMVIFPFSTRYSSFSIRHSQTSTRR